jgi:hypothetical protein
MWKSLVLSFILVLTMLQGFSYAEDNSKWCGTMMAIYQACSPELIANFLAKTSVPNPARTIRASDLYQTLPAVTVKPEAKPYTSPNVTVVPEEVEPRGFLRYYWEWDGSKMRRWTILN